MRGRLKEGKTRKQKSIENKARFAKMSPKAKAATKGTAPFHPEAGQESVLVNVPFAPEPDRPLRPSDLPSEIEVIRVVEDGDRPAVGARQRLRVHPLQLVVAPEGPG